MKSDASLRNCGNNRQRNVASCCSVGIANTISSRIEPDRFGPNFSKWFVSSVTSFTIVKRDTIDDVLAAHHSSFVGHGSVDGCVKNNVRGYSKTATK